MNAPVGTADARLKRVVADVLLIDDDQYQDSYGPDDIDTWDSLAAVLLASALEKEFGVAVPPDDMASFATIGDIREFCRANGIDV